MINDKDYSYELEEAMNAIKEELLQDLYHALPQNYKDASDDFVLQ